MCFCRRCHAGRCHEGRCSSRQCPHRGRSHLSTVRKRRQPLIPQDGWRHDAQVLVRFDERGRISSGATLKRKQTTTICLNPRTHGINCTRESYLTRRGERRGWPRGLRRFRERKGVHEYAPFSHRKIGPGGSRGGVGLRVAHLGPH